MLSDELRADAEIVTAAVAKHGASCLELAAESLRADRAFISTVHAAAADPRELLRWVAPELQADRDVVIAAADSGARLVLAGYIVQSFMRFPGYLSPSSSLKFADIPNGISGLAAVPQAGLLQILLFIGCAPPRPGRSDRVADAHADAHAARTCAG